MNAEEFAYDMYQAWGRLSREEGEAIRATDWVQVSRTQGKKGELQQKLLELERSAPAAGGFHPGIHLSPRLRLLVRELFRQEQENEAELARQRDMAERRRGELGQAQRQLRRLRRAYVPVRRSHWSSYS